LSLEHSPAKQRPRIGHNGGPPLTAAEIQVLNFRQAAALLNISPVTLKRRIKAGDGPRVLQISPARIGFRVIDLREYQEARLRSA
jgi:predicted DNA-binding transcriptional regulator AlpA